jgi:ATP-binding cassette subfamily F protein 3
MILLKACDLVRQFDADPILDGVSFEIRAGEKVGLVGPNGAGKSTLFGLLARTDTPDSGRAEYASGARIGLLEQDPVFNPNTPLIEEVRSGLGSLYSLQEEAEATAHAIAACEDDVERLRLQKRFDQVQADLHRQGGYAVEHRVEEVLHGLGFEDGQFGQSLGSLSGGQRNRAALARLLLARPEVLLLDEPTNHLDIAATEWLEKHLAQSDQAVIVVSHDRYFLDRVTTRILELFQGTTVDFPGNFSKYWQLKEERNKVLAKTFEKQQDYIARQEEFIRRNFYGQKATQAKDREKKLERLDTVDRPREIPTPSMGFASASRTGDWVFDVQDLCKGYLKPLFQDLTLRIPRGARVGIFGPNGAGKTTLLRTILGEIPADSGVVRRGTNVQIAYYDQNLSSVRDDDDLIEAVRPANNPTMTPAQIRDLLARFALKGEIVQQRVGSLSGGERSKVALAKVAALNANVLVLDEPTNHLDLWSCQALEETLKTFDGTLLFVSHDRYFLDRVATSLIVFEPGRWRYYEGNYTEYLDSMARLSAEQAAAAAPAKKSAAPAVTPTSDRVKKKRRFPYRKLEDLEQDVLQAEERIALLQDELANSDNHRDGEKMRDLQAEYEEAEASLALLYEQWEEEIELQS